MKTSCISHPPKTPLVIIREEYLAICDSDHCEAAILNQFEYWTNIKLGYQEQAEAEGEIARAGGLEIPQSDLWIYKTQTELHEELMGLFGIRAIGTALQSLVDRGFLERRNNPKYAWDRTYQYQLQTTKVQDAILQKCKMEKTEMQSQRARKRDIEPDQNEPALPEITTEITPKETTEKLDSIFPEKPVTVQFKQEKGKPNVVVPDDIDRAAIELIIKQTETHPGPCDLGLVTEQKQAAGGDWSAPPTAGGDDGAATAALVAMYEAIGSEPPAEASGSWTKAHEIVGQVLRDYGVVAIEKAKEAGRGFGQANIETPHFVNPHLSSFPTAFGIYVGKAKKQAGTVDTRRARDVEVMEASLAAFEERMAARPPPAEDDKVGQAVKGELQLQMIRATFDTWVKAAGMTCGDGVFTVTASNALTRDWLESRLATIIQRTAVGVVGRAVEVRFEVAGGLPVEPLAVAEEVAE